MRRYLNGKFRTLAKGGVAQKRGLHFGGGASEELLTMGFVKRPHCSNSEELPNSFF